MEDPRNRRGGQHRSAQVGLRGISRVGAPTVVKSRPRLGEVALRRLDLRGDGCFGPGGRIPQILLEAADLVLGRGDVVGQRLARGRDAATVGHWAAVALQHLSGLGHPAQATALQPDHPQTQPMPLGDPGCYLAGIKIAGQLGLDRAEHKQRAGTSLDHVQRLEQGLPIT